MNLHAQRRSSSVSPINSIVSNVAGTKLRQIINTKLHPIPTAIAGNATQAILNSILNETSFPVFFLSRNSEHTAVMQKSHAIPNTGILLLTEDNLPAAPGEVGEICIRGTCLTMGYYRMPEKTAECFVQNPLNDAYPELIYRTGDLGRYNDRVELQEIEAAAATHPEVAAACAVFDPEKDRIQLYYTGGAEPGELTAFLKSRLPRYMIPNRMERLERLPLNPNGKIDRKALAAGQVPAGV